MNKSLAVAYAMKRKAQKHRMAGGGMMTSDGYQSQCHEGCNSPCEVHPQSSGYESHLGDDVKPDAMAMEQDDKMLNQHGGDEMGPEGRHMAEGGYAEDGDDMDMVGRIMKKRQHMYAKGGAVANNTHPFEEDFEDPNEFDDMVLDDNLDGKQMGSNEHGDEYDADHNDLVAKIMLKRKKQHNPTPA